MEYYRMGTIISVQFEVNGIIETQKCILAKSFDSNELFQVITIDGWHAGEIEGYIKKEFNNNNTKNNLCTWGHLEKQLRERVFVNLKHLQLIEPKTITEKEITKVRNLLKN